MENLDILKNIKQVDAPPFLYAKVLHKINNPESELAPTNWKLIFSIAAILLIFLNTSILFSKSNKVENNDISSIVSDLNITSNNNLYNE